MGTCMLALANKADFWGLKHHSDLMLLRMLHTYLAARTAASRARYGVDALDSTLNSGHGLCCCGVLHLRQPTIVFNQAPVMGQGGNQMV